MRAGGLFLSRRDFVHFPFFVITKRLHLHLVRYKYVHSLDALFRCLYEISEEQKVPLCACQVVSRSCVAGVERFEGFFRQPCGAMLLSVDFFSAFSPCSCPDC